MTLEGARGTPPTVSDRTFAVALFVVALLARLGAAFALAAEPVWDGHYYDFGARRIAAGLGYSDDLSASGQSVWHPWCHYPVGYSGYLAGFYKVFGASVATANVANALAGALLALVTYLVAREALPSGRARLAGALVGLHPGLVLYGGLVMSEPLSALLVMLAFLVTLRGVRHPRGPWVGVAIGGFVLGVSALVRPQALLCLPFLAVALPAPDRAGWQRRAGAIVLAGATALLPILPWTARNCRVMDGCALVSTNAGWNLAIGAFPRATGRFETLRSSDGCREVTGQVQQDRCWFRYGVASIQANPGRWLALVPKKLSFTFDHESFPVEYLREARPTAWPEARRVAVRGVLSNVHRVLVALAAFAFLERPRRRTPRFSSNVVALGVVSAVTVGCFAVDPIVVWPLVIVGCLVPLLTRRPIAPALAMAVGLVATTAAAHAVFFGEDRYHMAATPAFCLLAAAALQGRSDKTHAARTPGVRAPRGQVQATK